MEENLYLIIIFFHLKKKTLNKWTKYKRTSEKHKLNKYTYVFWYVTQFSKTTQQVTKSITGIAIFFD